MGPDDLECSARRSQRPVARSVGDFRRTLRQHCLLGISVFSAMKMLYEIALYKLTINFVRQSRSLRPSTATVYIYLMYSVTEGEDVNGTATVVRSMSLRHLVLALSASLRPKYGTPYLFTSANPKHTLPSYVILRRTTFFQPISPPSGPVMRPDSLPRLWRYINLLLTYLLYGPSVWNSSPSTLRDSSLSLRAFKGQLKTYLFGHGQ